MAVSLSTTSYALLGLLAFDAESSAHGMTGYEVKQRADFTLRFYWVSPAMSQIYTELGRLADAALVETLDEPGERRTTRRYRITPTGQRALQDWLASSEPTFPVLKHPVALRLLMGRLGDPARLGAMLASYDTMLEHRTVELQAVRDMLGDDPERAYPALVAEWGLAYYRSEAAISAGLQRRLAGKTGTAVGAAPAAPVLAVHDLDAACDDYAARLGFVPGQRADGYAVVHRDAAAVRLVRAGLADHAPGAGSCRVRVAGIDGVHAELAATGALDAASLDGPRDAAWGARELTARDLDGNRVVFEETTG